MTVAIAIGVWVIALTLIWILYGVAQTREEIREIKHWALIMDNTLARLSTALLRPSGKSQFNKEMEL